MKVMKNFVLLSCVFGTCLFSVSCSSKYPDVSDKTYQVKMISDSEVAIGDLSYGVRERSYFVPEYIQEYKVTQLGYQSGLVSSGNGNFTQDSDATKVECFYYPFTITSVHNDYLRYGNSLDVMYCGEVLDLKKLDNTEKNTYYVPNEKYNDFLSVYSGTKKEMLKTANVVYDYNFDGMEYYYIDYIEEAEKIVNIPPNPSRDGYNFDGWYSDTTFVTKWNFETDTVSLNEENTELRLFAKWTE